MKFLIKNPKKFIIKSLSTVLIIFSIAVTGIYLYVYFASYKPTTKNFENIQSTIQDNYDVIVIKPKLESNTVSSTQNSLVFVPGGLVEPKSYIKFLDLVATKTKMTIYLQKPFLNLAITNVNQTSNIIRRYDLRGVTVAGHSLGGVVACRNVKENPDKFSKLILYGAYCDQSISELNKPVYDLVGANDQILNRKSHDEAKNNLPKGSTSLDVNGASHSGPFDYGLQKGDGNMDISQEKFVEVFSEVLLKI
jgi:hypothetical protein